MKTLLAITGVIVAIALIIMGELLIAAWREIKRLRKELEKETL